MLIVGVVERPEGSWSSNHGLVTRFLFRYAWMLSDFFCNKRKCLIRIHLEIVYTFTLKGFHGQDRWAEKQIVSIVLG